METEEDEDGTKKEDGSKGRWKQRKVEPSVIDN